MLKKMLDSVKIKMVIKMANKTIYVTGHRNPDSDSICSALAYAELKRLQGEEAQAVRQGPLNEESKYILKYFGVENPLLMSDARTKISDIDIDDAALVQPTMTIAQAWEKLHTVKNKSLCVVDEEEKLLGVISSSNLSSTREMSDAKLAELIKLTSPEQLAKTIQGKVVCESNDYNTTGEIYINTLKDETKFDGQFQGSIMILSDDEEKQRQLIDSGVRCLIITCKVRVSDEILQYAIEKDVTIIRTNLDTMKVAKLITDSIPVKYVMTKNPITCEIDEYVGDVASRLNRSRFRSYPVINEDGKVVGAVSRYHLSNYARRRFILVDHSASNQSIPNIQEAKIEEIIDHHHIGDVQTKYPIYYRNMICGCTSSIIATIYREEGFIPSREYAGLMLGAIISDTMYFKSETTKPMDRKMAIWLADLAQVGLHEFAKGVLGASVSLKEATPDEILNRDLKNYEMNKLKIGIGQTNFKHMEEVQVLLPTFKEHINNVAKEKGYDLLVMMFSNIMAEGSLFVVAGPKKDVVLGFIETTIDDMTGFDSQIISRKQQLMPKVSEAIEAL